MDKDFVKLAKEYEEQLIRDRRWLHRHPEVGLNLPETAAYLKNALESMGYEVHDSVGSSMYVIAGKGELIARDGEPLCLLLRADIDALPIKEMSQVSYAADGENGHLCGHDIHAAVLLTVARILKDIEDEIECLVKLVFQAGEEQSNAAELMVAGGIMENPRVHASLAMHVKPDADNGTVHYALGPATAAIDFYKVKLYGKSAHSSMPEKAKDPLFAANNIYQAFGSLVHRNLSAFNSAVLAVGMMSGGTAPNTIPDYVEMRGTLRSYSNDDQALLREKMRAVVRTQADMADVDGSIDFVWTPVTMNDIDFSEWVVCSFGKILGEENIIRDEKPVASSDDYAFFAAEVPSILFWFGVGEDGGLAIHDPNVVMCEDKLYLAAACICEVVSSFRGL